MLATEGVWRGEDPLWSPPRLYRRCATTANQLQHGHFSKQRVAVRRNISTGGVVLKSASLPPPPSPSPFSSSSSSFFLLLLLRFGGREPTQLNRCITATYCAGVERSNYPPFIYKLKEKKGNKEALNSY